MVTTMACAHSIAGFMLEDLENGTAEMAKRRTTGVELAKL